MTAIVGAMRSAAYPSRLGASVLLVVLADFLFYGHQVGWTAGLFCFVLLGLTALYNPAALRRPLGGLLFALCLALCLVLVETDNDLAFVLFCVLFAALFTQMRLDETPLTWLRKLFALAVNVCGAAAMIDGRTSHRHQLRTRGTHLLPRLAAGWLLPIAISVVFLALFARANPVINRWIISIEWDFPSDLFTPGRILFWLVGCVVIWGLLRAGLVRVAASSPAMEDGTASPLLAFLFSRDAVTRSLVAANLMFFAQNLLDANFLWAGATLPEGITDAEYAHRGAYPLIVTALLAAAFVLIAMRQGGGLKQDRLIRGLIYLWLLQNLVLVTSSIWRTHLYVSEYSLTYLRMAALLWMGLVMVGLLLVALKILWNLSSSWLIKANLFATLALLIATCPVDMGRFIADYNVTNSKEISGSDDSFFSGYFLDLDYLRSIGPSALPAIRRTLTQTPAGNPAYRSLIRPRLEQLAGDLYADLKSECADWRRWTYRAYRLCREMLPPSEAPGHLTQESPPLLQRRAMLRSGEATAPAQ